MVQAVVTSLTMSARSSGAPSEIPTESSVISHSPSYLHRRATESGCARETDCEGNVWCIRQCHFHEGQQPPSNLTSTRQHLVSCNHTTTMSRGSLADKYITMSNYSFSQFAYIYDSISRRTLLRCSWTPSMPPTPLYPRKTSPSTASHTCLEGRLQAHPAPRALPMKVTVVTGGLGLHVTVGRP